MLYTYFFVYGDDEMARLRVIHQFVALAAAILSSYFLFARGKVPIKWQIIILGGLVMAGAVAEFYFAYMDSDWLMRSWGGISAIDILGREYARIFLWRRQSLSLWRSFWYIGCCLRAHSGYAIK